MRATLFKQKTETRRVIKPQPEGEAFLSMLQEGVEVLQGGMVCIQGDLVETRGSLERWSTYFGGFKCPYGGPGDRLWVRENFWVRPQRSAKQMREGADTWPPVIYSADKPDKDELREQGWTQKPSIHMPRKYSRITLEVIKGWVEQIQSITPASCQAEHVLHWVSAWTGIGNRVPYEVSEKSKWLRWAFQQLWDSINGKPRKDGVDISWKANPWVWAIKYKLLEVDDGAGTRQDN